jgi:hypothetical protein
MLITNLETEFDDFLLWSESPFFCLRNVVESRQDNENLGSEGRQVINSQKIKEPPTSGLIV